MKIVKKEWHQVCSEFEYELDEEVLRQIYPNFSDDQISQLLSDIENGDVIVEDIVADAMDNDVELEWNHVHDDWWTDRKGGYEITYEVNTPHNFVERD